MKTKPLRISGRDPLTNRKLETYKLVFDLMKHLTTLSSGSILILIALVEKVLSPTFSKVYLTASFVCFCFSIICAIASMLLLGMTAADGKLTEGERNFFAIATSFSSISFGIGICFVAMLAVPSLLKGIAS